MPGDTFDAFVEDYYAECDEHLSAIRRLLLNAEARAPYSFESIERDDIVRRLETVRALSKIVALGPAEEMAKAVDEIIRTGVRGDGSVSRSVLDLLAAGIGLLDRSIQSKRGWHPVPDHRAFIAATRDFMRRERDRYATAVVQSAPAPADVPDVEIEEEGHRVALVPSPRRDAHGLRDAVVSVDVARFDDLMRVVAEMVVLRSRLDDAVLNAAGKGNLDDLRRTNRALERQLRALRENVTRMRRVTVDVLFERMRFITQDMLRGSGRMVRLQFRGSDTPIDAALVEQLLEPMLHVVRVAALHGIEDRAMRLGRGKPVEGTITVRAHAFRDRVVLETEDDGGGDDVASSRDAATASAMSSIRAAVGALGGEIVVSSAPWRGTRFTIDVPIQHAVTDALLVTVGDQTMAIPLLSLREVLHFDASTVTALPGGGGGAVMSYRGSPLSLLTLHRHFGLPAAVEQKAHVLVVERGGDANRLGLVVDGVVGIREIAIRPISDARVAGPGVAGAAELADGRLALIIDAAALVRRVRSASSTKNGGDVEAPAVL